MEIVQLPGKPERLRDGEEGSDSDSEEEGEETFLEDNHAEGEVVLLGFEMRRA